VNKYRSKLLACVRVCVWHLAAIDPISGRSG